MGKVNIKNRATAGNSNLCGSCSWGLCITGYRESDRLVICNKTTPDMVVPFAVLECSGFDDKYRPNWQQMQSLAIDLQPVRVSSRTAGFSTLSETHKVSSPDEEEFENEAALGDKTSQ